MRQRLLGALDEPERNRNFLATRGRRRDAEGCLLVASGGRDAPPGSQVASKDTPFAALVALGAVGQHLRASHGPGGKRGCMGHDLELLHRLPVARGDRDWHPTDGLCALDY